MVVALSEFRFAFLVCADALPFPAAPPLPPLPPPAPFVLARDALAFAAGPFAPLLFLADDPDPALR